MRHSSCHALICALACLTAGPAAAQQAAIAELSLEELANVEVTSAVRRQRKLSESANAVFVITREDIRRSGASSLPEVLRMAPVQRLQGARCISLRGHAPREL